MPRERADGRQASERNKEKFPIFPRKEIFIWARNAFLAGALAMTYLTLFLGPPFVGKSTQTNLVRDFYKVNLLSTADILRAPESQNITTNIADGKTGRLLTVAQLNARGLYSDSKTVLRLVREKIQTFGGAPIVSDSYPRSVEQLRDAVEELGLEFAGIFYMHASSTEVYLKIFERRREARTYCPRPGCSTFFDPVTNPADGMCPKDGTTLIKREDDGLDVAEKRYRSYLENAAPLVEALSKHKAFHDVVIDSMSGAGANMDRFENILPYERSPKGIFERDVAPHLRAYQMPPVPRVPA